MKIFFVLLSLAAHARPVAPNLAEYVAALAAGRGEDEICPLSLRALGEYDALVAAGVDPHDVMPGSGTNADLRARLIETVVACVEHD